MIANYHTHTEHCRHASGTKREYIEAAIAQGLDTLGFSDHVPMPYPNGYRPMGIRVPIEELEEYADSLAQLRDEYADRIRILIGFEAEYYPALFEDMLSLLGQVSYDYLIMGQHYVNNETDVPGSSSFIPHASEDELRLYVDQVIEGLSTGKFTYIAHPDVFRFEGDEEVYERHMRRLCEACLKMDIPLELNLLGLRDGRHYPSDRFFRIVGEVGNAVVLGCDAHRPCDMAVKENIEQGLQMAEKYGLKIVDRVTVRDPRA